MNQIFEKARIFIFTVHPHPMAVKSHMLISVHSKPSTLHAASWQKGEGKRIIIYVNSITSSQSALSFRLLQDAVSQLTNQYNL
jgi:hypothetical protein